MHDERVSSIYACPWLLDGREQTGARSSLIVYNQVLRGRPLGCFRFLGGARAPSSVIRVSVLGARDTMYGRRGTSDGSSVSCSLRAAGFCAVSQHSLQSLSSECRGSFSDIDCQRYPGEPSLLLSWSRSHRRTTNPQLQRCYTNGAL